MKGAVAQVKFTEIVEAFEFVSSGQPMENEAYLSRETGRIYWHSEIADDFEEVPADLDEPGKYLPIPHKSDLGLGKPLALRFTEEWLPASLPKVRDIFARRGAYGYFKQLLESCGALEKWYAFEASAQRDALREWCRDNEVEIDG